MAVDIEIYKKGEIIFFESQVGKTVYLIKEGKVEISKQKNGKKIVLSVLSKNGIFGEMALIDNQPRMASATALEETHCLTIPAETFNEKLDGLDPFMKGIWRITCTNLRIMAERFVKEVGVEALYKEGGGT